MSLAAQTVAARAGVREKTGAPRTTPKAFADFHIHTRFSRDSILSEDKFIRVALERGLTHVAITNHNNVEGAIAVRDRAQELGVERGGHEPHRDASTHLIGCDTRHARAVVERSGQSRVGGRTVVRPPGQHLRGDGLTQGDAVGLGRAVRDRGELGREERVEPRDFGRLGVQTGGDIVGRLRRGRVGRRG